jgi:hypothetical protein
MTLKTKTSTTLSPLLHISLLQYKDSKNYIHKILNLIIVQILLINYSVCLIQFWLLPVLHNWQHECLEQKLFTEFLLSLYCNSEICNKDYYYIRLYFAVFLLAGSNTRDIPFSNILISKMQFLWNEKSYCTLVQNQWLKWCHPLI